MYIRIVAAMVRPRTKKKVVIMCKQVQMVQFSFFKEAMNVEGYYLVTIPEFTDAYRI